MRIAYFDWQRAGGKWLPLFGGFGVIFLVKWTCLAVGVEIMPRAVSVFIGPLAIGVGRPSE